MNLTSTYDRPTFNPFYERQAIEQLTYSNHYLPTKSHYPIRLLRIKERHIVPSIYQGREWRLCPSCWQLFIEELGDYTYTFHPHSSTLNSSYIHFDRKEWKEVVHCCSKECLTKAAARFAIKSVTEKGKLVIHVRKIREDIKEVIETFH